VPDSGIRTQEIPCSTAREFIEEISRVSEDPIPPDFRNIWVYRGHADKDWKLQPSAWREDGRKKLAPLHEWLRPIVTHNLSQRFSANSAAWQNSATHEYVIDVSTEILAVRQFCDLADEIGLVIPEADKVPGLCDDIIAAVVARPTGGLGIPDAPFAFAQHHGIPTRFLDWTRDPLIAAFFAVESLPATPAATDLCVWAALPRIGQPDQLHWVTVPRGHHPFVHAQNSMFSVDPRSELHYPTLRRWRTYQEAEHPPDAILYKWTLPVGEARKLSVELFRRGITRARLMPTLDNVAKTAILRWNWYKD